jgi:hypothetical protein
LALDESAVALTSFAASVGGLPESLPHPSIADPAIRDSIPIGANRNFEQEHVRMVRTSEFKSLVEPAIRIRDSRE